MLELPSCTDFRDTYFEPHGIQTGIGCLERIGCIHPGHAGLIATEHREKWPPPAPRAWPQRGQSNCLFFCATQVAKLPKVHEYTVSARHSQSGRAMEVCSSKARGGNLGRRKNWTIHTSLRFYTTNTLLGTCKFFVIESSVLGVRETAESSLGVDSGFDSGRLLACCWSYSTFLEYWGPSP